MSDLISRSATIQRFIQETEDSGSNVIHINTIKRVLQDIETAYDVDAVVKDIREYAECDDECCILWDEGYCCKREIENLVKTGRHIDIEHLLEQIRGNE